MADPFTAEIRAFGFDFAPIDWARCWGQQIALVQFQAYASVTGNLYGSTGSGAQTLLNLPDLRGRAAAHVDTNAGVLGSAGTLAATLGVPSVSLSYQQMPVHDHLATTYGNGTSFSGTPSATAYPSIPRAGVTAYDAWTPYAGSATTSTLAPLTLGVTYGSGGAAAPHDNASPYLGLNFCICLNGEYPMRA